MPGSGEVIWYADPKQFLNDQNAIKIIPDASMTRVEQLNAVLRFALYFTILLVIVRRSWTPIFILLFVAVLTWGMHKSATTAEMHREQMLDDQEMTVEPRSGKVCTKPSLHNPFMNVLSSDAVLRPRRPAACNIQRSDVKKDMERKFAHNLYLDSDDPLNRKTSSRQFYTMPVTTIPGDQTAFAKWLYDVGGATCKDGNGSRCAALAHRPYLR
jgi:Family of unknown function (DUF5762)